MKGHDKTDRTSEPAANASPMAMGFFDFAAKHCQIEDKTKHAKVPCVLTLVQREFAGLVLAGKWLAVLKSRQIGLTTVLVCYVAWLLTCNKCRSVAVINQNKEYAADFLRKVSEIIAALPPWMNPGIGSDANDNFTTLLTSGRLRCVAGSRRALRSGAYDFVVFDEAAFIGYLDAALQAAEPAVESAGGSMILLSSSDGPGGAFYETFRDASLGGSRYQPVFYGWRARPGRDDKWYAAMREKYAAKPLILQREYPASPDEAFSTATGKVYPLFSTYGEAGKRFVKVFEENDLSSKAHFIRGIDFGGVDAFVCLFSAFIPAPVNRLYIDPACANLIRELSAYKRTAGGQPADANNHACDALRYQALYARTHFGDGILWPLGEIYEPNTAARGISLDELADRILGDFPRAFDITVADRSRPDSILSLTKRGIFTVPHSDGQSAGYAAIENGICAVQEFVIGTALLKQAPPVVKKTSMVQLRRGLWA